MNSTPQTPQMPPPHDIPDGIAADDWAATPLTVRTAFLALVAQVAALEQRLAVLEERLAVLGGAPQPEFAQLQPTALGGRPSR